MKRKLEATNILNPLQCHIIYINSLVDLNLCTLQIIYNIYDKIDNKVTMAQTIHHHVLGSFYLLVQLKLSTIISMW
jgi:hypothetical protein